MVMMKIDEFVEKVNRNDRMEAKKVDSVIAIWDDSEHEVIDIPCDATNLLEIEFCSGYFHFCFGKPSREYLSALIEELLHTPIEERFPEKKYRVPLVGFISDNGRQYLTTDGDSLNDKFFACALRSELKQEFTMDEINQLTNSTQFKSIPWIQKLLQEPELVEDD